MQVSPGLISGMYDSFWKAHQWPSELLFSKDSKIFLAFYDDGDYVCSEVGTCDKEIFCIELSLNQAKSAIKLCDDSKMMTVKYKNSKLQFSSEDKNIQFVVVGKDQENPLTLPANIIPNHKLPMKEINFASAFTDKEYPFNFVYFDDSSSSVFSSSGGQIFGGFNFKNPKFAIPSYFAKIFPSVDALEVQYDSDSLLYSKDKLQIKCKTFTPDKDLSLYYNLISKPKNFHKLSYNSLKDALAPHVACGMSEITIQIGEESISVASVSSGDSIALRTNIVCKNKSEDTFVFRPKEFANICAYIDSVDSGDSINLAKHDKFENISIVFGKKCMFAVV